MKTSKVRINTAAVSNRTRAEEFTVAMMVKRNTRSIFLSSNFVNSKILFSITIVAKALRKFSNAL